jgi:tetratricopeptide (TPR) repeat protein
LQQFGTAEVSRLTHIPIPAVRAMVRARYVSPRRGPRGSLRFSFQDLVLLRTARSLLAARISPRRVGTALRAIRAQLPDDLPARGLSITADGDRVVVHEGGERRDALSGQLLLAFEVRIDDGKIELLDVSEPPARERTSGDECTRQFEAALALEETDIQAAVEAYRTCVARHAHSGAAANLGRLLHLEGRISEAVRVYRSIDKPDADVLYNLAVALEDLGETKEALATYSRVLDLDKEFADAHHNIARLYQEAGDQRRALRHWNAYRRLSRAQ